MDFEIDDSSYPIFLRLDIVDVVEVYEGEQRFSNLVLIHGYFINYKPSNDLNNTKVFD